MFSLPSRPVAKSAGRMPSRPVAKSRTRRKPSQSPNRQSLTRRMLPQSPNRKLQYAPPATQSEQGGPPIPEPATNHQPTATSRQRAIRPSTARSPCLLTTCRCDARSVPRTPEPRSHTVKPISVSRAEPPVAQPQTNQTATQAVAQSQAAPKTFRPVAQSQIFQRSNRNISSRTDANFAPRCASGLIT